MPSGRREKYMWIRGLMELIHPSIMHAHSAKSLAAARNLAAKYNQMMGIAVPDESQESDEINIGNESHHYHATSWLPAAIAAALALFTAFFLVWLWTPRGEVPQASPQRGASEVKVEPTEGGRRYILELGKE